MHILNSFINRNIEAFCKIFFQKIKHGNINVILPSGKSIYFKGNEIGVDADIKLYNYSFINKIIDKGSIGFAESYIDNDFSTSNLSNLLILAKNNEKEYLNLLKGKWLYSFVRKFKHHLNQNTKSRSKKNIKYHYDLGNKFYELWLDETMTYSSGLFNKPNDNLFQAQINKYQHIIKHMELNDKTSVLEIGCGWGGFTTFAAKTFKSNIKAITISKKQYDYTSKRIFQEGLADKVKVELKDYRDINEKFDHIVSIEMFEAVGKKYWPVFFNKIKNSLKINGLAALQVITIEDNRAENYQKNPDFIQSYIFPGGVLPSKNQLFDITSELDLKICDYINFGVSYAKTLYYWNKKFQNSWLKIAEQGFSENFKKMWEYYFAYCEAGFINGNIDVSQFIIKK